MAEQVRTKKTTAVKRSASKEKSPKGAAPKKSTTREKKTASVPQESLGRLSVRVYDTKGTQTGVMELPEVLFGEKVNLPLIAQAVRVYQMGQRQGDASTKTRGEVDGSTRKIYRQKGTGRARHGGIRAPIFVKGGIAHGPKPRDYDATLSKKMKLKAFVSALSAKCAEGSIRIVEGLESIEPKTKHAESFFRALELPKSSRSVLMVVPVAHQSAKRAFRNLAGVDTYNAEQISVYDVLSHKQLVFAKESISVLEKRRNA